MSSTLRALPPPLLKPAARQLSSEPGSQDGADRVPTTELNCPLGRRISYKSVAQCSPAPSSWSYSSLYNRREFGSSTREKMETLLGTARRESASLWHGVSPPVNTASRSLYRASVHVLPRCSLTLLYKGSTQPWWDIFPSDWKFWFCCLLFSSGFLFLLLLPCLVTGTETHPWLVDTDLHSSGVLTLSRSDNVDSLGSSMWINMDSTETKLSFAFKIL